MPPQPSPGQADMDAHRPPPVSDAALLAMASISRGITLGDPNRWDHLVRHYATRFTGRPRGRPKKNAAALPEPDPIAAAYRKAGVDPSSKDAARTCALHFARKEAARLFPARPSRPVGRQGGKEFIKMATILAMADVLDNDSATIAARKVAKLCKRAEGKIGYEETDEETLIELIKRYRRKRKNKSDPN